MNFNELYKVVEKSKQYKDFIKKNPDAELCAAFFVLDFDSEDNKQSLDFKVGEKIFTFDYSMDKIIVKEDKLLEVKGKEFPKLEKISGKIKVEVDELKSIAGLKAFDEGIAAKFQKIIAVLQNHSNKQFWNLTCIMQGLLILNILIDSESGKVLKFEKRSMMDIVKK